MKHGFLYLHVLSPYTPTAAITAAPTPVLCNPSSSTRPPRSAPLVPVLSAEQSRARALPDLQEQCVCNGPMSAHGLISQLTGQTACMSLVLMPKASPSEQGNSFRLLYPAADSHKTVKVNL